MYRFEPYITLDGSVGLYNSDFNDIYHSVEGAVTEAYEKFILPVDLDILCTKENIKVLDICYGIGYNSKCFLNYLIEKKYFRKNFSKKISSKFNSSASIYTNNIFIRDGLRNNYTIYSDNTNMSIYIKAVDTDNFLFFISPFIKTGLKFHNFAKLKSIYKNVQFPSKNTKIKKINNLINFLFFEKIAQKYPEIFIDSAFEDILCNKDLKRVFDSLLKTYFLSIKHMCLNNSQGSLNFSNLHNIYYKYITKWYKWRVKSYNLQGINFEPVIDDARNVIKVDKNKYNLIFLDAFTPSKCPCLWSYDFIKMLFEHLNDDGLLLTYSAAAPVRNAMRAAGFYIGYIYNERTGKNVGTMASKNKSLIKYPLSEFDFGLLNTKAGIFYRDEDLSASNEAILSARKKEYENSDKISSTAYKSKFAK